jgi:signal transduction histidine kinase
MFQEAVAIVRPVAADYGMDIVTEISDSLPPVEVDNDMILRVVTNLLENAVKYTGQDGTITLKSFANEREVVIAIRDSGPGIPYHMQKQIFDKFTRVKYKDAPKGIGLGLAFCKLAIEAHGGQIWVESEPGNGAEFLFTLPLAGETVAPTE